jgi:hypothetical protein
VFSSETSNIAVDSVFAAEGKFQWNQLSGQTLPELSIVMAYAKKSTGTTFGSCPVRSGLLRPETLSAFAEFIRMAEEDFGRLVFEGSGNVQLGMEPSPPEVNRGLTGIGGK